MIPHPMFILPKTCQSKDEGIRILAPFNLKYCKMCHKSARVKTHIQDFPFFFLPLQLKKYPWKQGTKCSNLKRNLLPQTLMSKIKLTGINLSTQEELFDTFYILYNQNCFIHSDSRLIQRVGETDGK